MFTLIRRRIVLTLSALLMILSISIFPLAPEAAAVRTFQNMNISEASSAMGYYYALRTCVRRAIAASNFSVDTVNKQGYFGDEKIILGGQFISGDGDWDGYENCSNIKDKTSGEDGGWVHNAVSTLGYGDGRDFLCHVMSGGNNSAYDSCRNGQGNISTYEFARKTQDEREAAFSQSVGKRVFGNTEPLNRPEGDAIMQNILYNTFYTFCQPTDHNGGAVGSDLQQLAIKAYKPGPPPGYADKQVVIKKTRLNMTVGIIEASPGGMNRALSCKDMPGNISLFADRATPKLANMPTGFLTNANTGTSPNQVQSDGDLASSCKPEGIGWIICPVSNAIADMTDGLFNIVSSLMRVEPILGNKDHQVNLQSSWGTMRNIANVAFVIAFMVIIYSQLTSMGISNHGIKKMLPRLIVAAILVNLSYYICAILVDLSNIIGMGLQDMLMGLRSRASLVSTGTDLTNLWGSITAAILSSGAVAAAGVTYVALANPATLWAAVAGLVALMIPSLIALLTAFLVLILRQALIIILIIISPLAFVAYLLPNTESWYKKWQSLFFAMLLMFPVLSVVFGGSQLAASFLMASSDTGTLVGLFMYLGALAVQAIPLFIAPVLFKLSSGVLNRFAGIVNNPNRGLADMGRKKLEEVRDLQNKRGLAGNNRFGAIARAKDFRRRTRDMKGKMYDATSEAKWQEDVAQNGDLQGIFNTTTAENSRAGEAQKAQKRAYASALGQDPALLSTAAGIGGQAAATKLQAAAKAEAKQLHLDEVKAQSVLIDELNSSELQALGTGGRAGRFNADGNLALQQAAMQKLAKTESFEQLNQVMNHVNTTAANSTARRALADVLEESRPGYVGMADIQNIRTGATDPTTGAMIDNSANALLERAVQKQVYSAAKIGQIGNEELKIVAEYAFDPANATPDNLAGRQKLVENAYEALRNPDIATNIGKTRGNVENIRFGRQP